MSNDKNNQTNTRPSLLVFLKSEESQELPYLIIIAIGIVIALFAGIFIKNGTWSMLLCLLGGVITVTGTEALSKKIPSA